MNDELDQMIERNMQLSSHHPFIGRDLSWLVNDRAAKRPDKPFLIWSPFGGEERRWSYAEFAEEVKAYASGLSAYGIEPGDPVVIHLNNCPEFLLAWFALSRIGAIAVTTNTRSPAEEVAYFISHSRAVAAITQPAYVDMVHQVSERLHWIACLQRDPEGDGIRAEGFTAFESLRGCSDQAHNRVPDLSLPNNIQYTSGTTSRPKAVVWTQANAMWAAKINASHLKLTDADIHPVFLPLFHTNAMAYSTLATLWSGGTIVLTPRFSASRFWDIAVKYRCTWATTVPFCVHLLDEQQEPDTHYFRFWACGADRHFVRKRWGIRALGWYGMTETVSQCAFSDLDDDGPEGSMGYSAPEYGISIRRESGDEVVIGEVGHLWIKGVPGLSLFAGYLHNPRATADAFDKDGWFDTGDLVRADELGHLFFEGRIKDMLKVGGENVAASEIERVINKVPGVLESAVVGKPDKLLDEVPVAFVVSEGEQAGLDDAVMSQCRANLADFKLPREIVFVDSLPRGTLEKILKNTLRERLLNREELNREESGHG